MGNRRGGGKIASNAFVQKCLNNNENLISRIKVFPNPYAFCNDWDNDDFLLPELTAFRKELIKNTQIIVAFTGGKGTSAEIKTGIQQGSIIIPIVDSDDFDKEIEKYPEIMATIKTFDPQLETRIECRTVRVEDIIRCIRAIIQ